jgi:protein arginine kinase
MLKTVHACKEVDPSLVAVTDLTIKERQSMIAKRWISPNFAWQEPGRAVLLSRSNESRQVLSVMINEEDHLRIQMIAPELEYDQKRLRLFVKDLETVIPFAFTDNIGYLAASVVNSGTGTRYSALVHLIGLQLTGELEQVLGVLVDSNLTLRGAFGEGTKPIGSFLQISSTSAEWSNFRISCDYLVEKESTARQKLQEGDVDELKKRSARMVFEQEQIDFVQTLRFLSLRRLIASQCHPQYLPLVDQQIESAEASHGAIDDEDQHRNRIVELRRLLEITS